MGKKALLVVDVQNDFCPQGALGIAGGDTIIPVLNKYIAFFEKKGLPILFSRDWHPRMSKHFKDFGGVWPFHCIQGTWGAQFHHDLKLPKSAIVLSKGIDPKKDGYSAFEAVDAQGKNLESILTELGVREIFIGGLATDYCVKSSSLEAVKLNFNVTVLTDAIKGVDLKPGDSQSAIKEMIEKGARVIYFEDFTKE